MTNQRFSILLIVMMVITPVASAFSHCTAMVEPGHFTESQSATVTVLADDAVASQHQDADQHYHQMQSDSCHAGSGCTLHVCGGYGMTQSASTFAVTAANCFTIIEHASPESTILSPDIKPPIAIL